MRKLVKLLTIIAIAASGAANLGCIIWTIDEPVAPKSMLD